jgi:hypothetical protein
MKTFFKFIGLICFITFSQQVKSQSIDELTIFNSLLDSIYDINTCINKQDLDSLNPIMIINDSLSTLDIMKSKKYLLTQIPKTSRFFALIKNIRKPLKARGFNLDSLEQWNIKFMTTEEFDNRKYEHRFGKTGKQLFLGYFDLSRIYVDNMKGIAIFKMNWIGGGTCGYEKLILIYRDRDTWKIEKQIGLGVY